MPDQPAGRGVPGSHEPVVVTGDNSISRRRPRCEYQRTNWRAGVVVQPSAGGCLDDRDRVLVRQSDERSIGREGGLRAKMRQGGQIGRPLQYPGGCVKDANSPEIDNRNCAPIGREGGVSQALFAGAA